MSRPDYTTIRKDVLSLVGERSATRTAAPGTIHKLKLAGPDQAGIPAGSVIEVMELHSDDLAYGDLVYVRLGSDPLIGRFLRLDGQDVILADRRQSHRIQASKAVGRIQRAHYGGRDFHPQRQGFLGAIVNRLTDFGTFARLRGIPPARPGL